MIHTLESTGIDQSDDAMALCRAASSNDTLEFVPVNDKPFVFDQTAYMTSIGKTVHVRAEGATFTGKADPLIAFGGVLGAGGAVGQRSSGNWKGGAINGNVQLINWCYSHWNAGVVGTLSLVLDNCASYNTIRGNIGTADGSGPAILVDQRNNGAWANAITFRDCNLRPGKDGTIVQGNKAAYALGVWRLYACNIEGSGKLLNVGMSQLFFYDCYCEGSLTLGDYDQHSHIVFRDLGGAVPWTMQPGIIFEGSQYQ